MSIDSEDITDRDNIILEYSLVKSSPKILNSCLLNRSRENHVSLKMFQADRWTLGIVD